MRRSLLISCSTGIREGELLALTPADFLPGLKLSITKSFAVVEGEHIIKDPKTENSNRTIAIPQLLYNEVQEYFVGLYGLQPTDRLFMFTKSFLLYEVKRMAKVTDWIQSGCMIFVIHTLPC